MLPQPVVVENRSGASGNIGTEYVARSPADASNIDETIAFYMKWFDARVVWDSDYGGARNVFIKIGIGAMHLYEQPPRDRGRNAVHHLGFQVVGLHDLYKRMKAAGIDLPNPVREHSGGGYFMVKAPDDVLLEVFEPGPSRDPRVLDYYGLGMSLQDVC